MLQNSLQINFHINKMSLKENVVEYIEQFIKSEYLSIANVCFFMQQIRILNEINQTQNNYIITNHYCNWLLHKELNRSNSPIIMEQISQSLKTFNSKIDLIKKISDSLSLIKLVTELKEILWINLSEKKILINSQIENDDYWLKFVGIILNQISFRPLLVRNNHISIDNLEFSIYGIQIAPENEKYNIEILSHELESRNKRILINILL